MEYARLLHSLFARLLTRHCYGLLVSHQDFLYYQDSCTRFIVDSVESIFLPKYQDSVNHFTHLLIGQTEY